MEGQKTRGRKASRLVQVHLVVDPATHDIVAVEVTLENVHDAEVLPTLLNPLQYKLGCVYTDCTNHSKVSHQLIAHKGATAYIPLRKNAGLWQKGHPRNKAVLVIPKVADRTGNISVYHRCLLAETAM